MRENARHIGAEEGICKETEHDCHHRQPHDATRRLNDEQNADPAHDDICRCGGSGAGHKFAVLDDDVGGCRRTEDGKEHIDRVEEVIARPRTTAGIEQICECKPKAKMDGTLQLCIEDAERCRVELKDGECNGNGCDDFLWQPRVVGGV